MGAFDVTNTAVEPTMEGFLPFVTRHERRYCEVLPEVFAERPMPGGNAIGLKTGCHKPVMVVYSIYKRD